MYADAREFFNAVAEANRDAERVKRQLDALEHRALGMSGGGFEPRVRSTPAHDKMGSSVAALVDQESTLTKRLEDDYALLNQAHALLYGTDNESGLWSLVGLRADALALHYVNGLRWAEVGSVLGYTEQHVWREAQVALDTCDGWGFFNVTHGLGAAQN